MEDIEALLPLVIIALLAVLAAGTARMIPGSRSLREQVAWTLITVSAAYASGHWLWLFIELGTAASDEPIENFIRLVMLAGSVVALFTVSGPLRRQRLADRDRADAEERFRRTMDGSTQPMGLVGPDGRYRYVNQASQALFQYSAADVVGRHYSEFLSHEDTSGEHVARALESAFGRASVQRRVRRGDGSELIVEIEMIALGDGNMLFVGHDITERVALAERVEREHVRLRYAQEVSHVGSVEINLITGERWWSDEMYRLHGMEPQGAAPAYPEVWAQIHPDDREYAQQMTEEVLAGRTHEPFVFRLILPSGEIRHLLQHSRIEHDADGTAVRATRVASDVTMLQTAQADLDRERQRLQLAQHISSVGSGETNLLTGERWWSAQMYELFGLTPDEEPPPFEVARLRVHPDDRALTEQSTNDVLAGRAHRPVEFRVVHPDGQIRHLLMHAHLERNEAGVPAVVTRVAIDITELREVQADLERERIRLRYAQEASHVGNGEWNLQDRTSWWSDEMFRLLGFEPGSIEPSHDLFVARLVPEDRELHEESVTRLLAGYHPAPTVLRIALPDGSPRSVLCQIQLERDEAGVPLLVTGVLIDVTEFLALQEQLGQAKRLEAIGTLTAGIAHDFNNLLTVIGGSIELAEMGELRRLEQADQAVQRATALVRQLLQFSRSGDVSARDESMTLVDLRTVAREAAEGLVDDPAGPVVLDLPRQAVIATVDPTRVHRVLMNLLVNARDAVQEVVTSSTTPFRPEIRVAVRPTEATEERAAGVELEVRDNGSGMPPQVRDRIFEPFFTTKAPGRGTGLGLPTVYGTVRDMHGTIELTSEVGAGTSFRVWLPLTPPKREVPEHRAGEARRVLILDDQEELLEFSAESLRRAGYTVTTATTSETALAQLQEAPYDLAILDAFVDEVSMPELLARIRRMRPEQRVMACSGSASRAQAIAWGADEYLAKPFSAELLVRTVRDIAGAPTDLDGVAAALV